MPMPGQARDFDNMLNVNSAATISAGFTVAIPCPTRGEIIGVYIGPIDGTTAITGTGVLTISSGGVSGATATFTAATSGFATGTTQLSAVTLSARQFVNEGDMIKLVLAAGLTCAVNAVVTVVVRARSI